MSKMFDLRLSKAAFARLTGLAILTVLLFTSVFMGTGVGASSPSATAPAVTPITGTETPASEKVSVYIVGSVVSPGVYSVDSGALLCDLIEMCGGLTDDADPASVNMVYRIEKNCMITVGGDTTDETVCPDSVLYPEAGTDSVLVNINTATLEQLCSLPGIGQATAKKIISYRESTPFSSIEELMNVSGIGESKFNDLKAYITAE
jgi:competence protein ComEA